MRVINSQKLLLVVVPVARDQVNEFLSFNRSVWEKVLDHIRIEVLLNDLRSLFGLVSLGL